MKTARRYDRRAVAAVARDYVNLAEDVGSITNRHVEKLHQDMLRATL
jgi:hypothetical protein